MRSKIMFLGIILGLLVVTACSSPGEEAGGEEYSSGDGIDYGEIGRITGTITLTDVPNPAPQVYISVNGNNGSNWWSSYSYQINIQESESQSGTFENISWSIPIYQYNGFVASTGNFRLRIDTANSNSFYIDIPFTPYIYSKNANVGSLGTVSIKSITLNGTINVTQNGQPVPRVSIEAYLDDNYSWTSFGSVWLDSPGYNAPWSITIPALNYPTPVRFRVNGYLDDSGNYIFSKEITPSPEVNAYNTNIQGINLNLGNITIITLSGTVNVTNNGQAVPHVTIEAYSDNGYSWTQLGSAWLESPGSNAQWSMTMEALNSSTPVRFRVSGSSTDYRYLFDREITPSPEVNVFNTNVSGINLNLGNIITVTLSGTINVTYNGHTVYYVSIEAFDNNTGNSLGSTSFNSPGPNESWSITMQGLNSSTPVRFRVQGYSTDWNYLFNREIIPSPAVNAYNTNVSGINLNLGNITSITLSGTVNVTYNGQAVDYVSIEAYDNTGNFLGSTYLNYPGSNESWSITMLSLNSSTPVRFIVSGYSYGGYFNREIIPSPAVNVFNTNLSGINLNLGDLNTPENVTPLTANTWVNGEIVNNVDVRWYSINVTSGTSYYIWWNDNYQGDSTKGLDVKVNAIYSDGTLIFPDEDSGWSTPKSFTAYQSGTVYIGVKPWTSGDTGTYAIVYSTSSTRPNTGSENVSVTFSVTANGGTVQTTTQLTLNFSQAISGLTANDITISGVYGVQKGTLSGSGTSYTLPISGFSSGGTLYVSVSKTGYIINSSPQTVEIYHYTAPPAITFNSVIANGSPMQTTTQLTLHFSHAIDGLTANDINISGVYGVHKGLLSGSGSTYTLQISGFTENGTVSVSVSKPGYTITDSPKTVYIYYYASTSVGIVINLTEINEWQLTEQTAQTVPNTNKVFTVTGTYATYKWYLDGIPVGTASSYLFNKPAGVYQLVVVVTNNNGESRSGRCWITVAR